MDLHPALALWAFRKAWPYAGYRGAKGNEGDVSIGRVVTLAQNEGASDFEDQALMNEREAIKRLCSSLAPCCGLNASASGTRLATMKS